MKAKSIDRLEYTKSRCPNLKGQNVTQQPQQVHHRQFYSVCPQCGRETLRHDGSCVMCENCSYSKCG